MRIELTPGMTNVVRFPIERRARPSLELLGDISPDPREVDMVIEAFGFDDCVADVREAADAAMADYIANHVRPEPGRGGGRRSTICCGRLWSGRRWPAARRMRRRAPRWRRRSLW